MKSPILSRGLGVAVLLSALAGGGCDTGPPFLSGDSRIRYAPESARDSRRNAALVPLLSCIDSITSVQALTLIAHLEPAEHLDVGTADSGPVWAPADLVDAAPLGSGFVALDAGNAEITVLSDELGVVRSWGRRGGGPGELAAPTAIAVAPAGDTIWVLDSAPARLVAFDSSGRYLRDMRIPSAGADLAIDGLGRYYIAHRVVVAHVSAAGEEPDPFVTVLDRTGTELGSLRSVLPNDDDPRLNLPGPITPRLSAGGRGVAVAYPASGIVDVYEGVRLVGTARTCVPEAVREGYARQLSAAKGPTGSQASVTLVSDTHLGIEGGPSVLGLVRTEDGLMHVDRFDRDGEPLGSIALTDTAFVPVRARFDRSGERFLTITGTGELKLYAYR